LINIQQENLTRGADMKKNNAFFGLFLAALVLLPGCYKIPMYRSKPLKSVSADFTYRGVENKVILQAKRLTRDDVQYLFSSRSEQLDGAVEVVYFSVHNLSSAHYELSSTDIAVPQVSYKDLARMIKTSSIGGLGRVAAGAGGVGASYYLTIASIFAAKGYMGAFPVLIPMFGFPVVGIISAGVALIYSGKFIKSMVMNSRISRDLKEKTVHKKVVIGSGQQYDGLIFVQSSDYSSTFTVTILEKDNMNNTLTFAVDLKQNEQ
jgi:hypothetical protein